MRTRQKVQVGVVGRSGGVSHLAARHPGLRSEGSSLKTAYFTPVRMKKRSHGYGLSEAGQFLPSLSQGVEPRSGKKTPANPTGLLVAYLVGQELPHFGLFLWLKSV